ncbi:hypothetical protein AQI95_40770 [Streptomyces yokosukanensis]|uniref:Uncharacterized protein n=1 Tax=Streptomyces yokosukanensis TaxID=67386 RepID=A0A101NTN0_9ACTN|nr:hypothetical protein AQI95_40770 [Streptomyces yokosukanensis]
MVGQAVLLADHTRVQRCQTFGSEEVGMQSEPLLMNMDDSSCTPTPTHQLDWGSVPPTLAIFGSGTSGL